MLRKKVPNEALPPSPVLPTTSISESTTSESTNRFVRYIMKQHDKEAPPVEPEHMSNTGNVLRRLDEAILSLENDKRQLDKFQFNVRPSFYLHTYICNAM